MTGQDEFRDLEALLVSRVQGDLRLLGVKNAVTNYRKNLKEPGRLICCQRQNMVQGKDCDCQD